ncbi:Uncharacterised protein [Paenibacillus macerans]|uniref:Uncharacterized protein n=1 Tax=Paenibacillus macerans TaxID=44252 RepID=A0A090ZPE3_PAEMA|nr:hypothetical protein DJ90_2006 [Paenibacillus macerans]SUA84391.1 Uncharacterised protein [Paenibacillus macerans]
MSPSLFSHRIKELPSSAPRGPPLGVEVKGRNSKMSFCVKHRVEAELPPTFLPVLPR